MRRHNIIYCWLASLLMFSLLLSACEFHKDNKGYPDKVMFSAEGGQKQVIGGDVFVSFDIYIGSDVVASSSPTLSEDSVSAAYEWITVKQKQYDKKLEIEVSPANNHKQRKCMIVGWMGREYAEIKVIQSGY